MKSTKLKGPFIRVRSIKALLLIFSPIVNFFSAGLSHKKVYAVFADAYPDGVTIVPINGAVVVPLSSDIAIKIGEAVNMVGSWISLSCAGKGA